MNKLQALNTWMTPKMPLLILGALALGLLFPDQIGLLCPAVSALMMFQTFANIGRALAAYGFAGQQRAGSGPGPLPPQAGAHHHAFSPPSHAVGRFGYWQHVLP